MTTLLEKSEQINLRIFKCQHCGGIIGNTTDNILYVGTVKLKRTITMECSYCDKIIYWRPSKESTTKVS